MNSTCFPKNYVSNSDIAEIICYYLLESSDKCSELYNTTKQWREMCGPVFDSQRNLKRLAEDIWLIPPVVGPQHSLMWLITHQHPEQREQNREHSMWSSVRDSP